MHNSQWAWYRNTLLILFGCPVLGPCHVFIPFTKQGLIPINMLSFFVDEVGYLPVGASYT